MMVEFFRKLRYIFDKRQKLETLYMIVLIIIGSGMELLGVSAISPFIDAIMEPRKTIATKPYNYIYDALGIENYTQFIILLSVGLIFIYIFKNLFLVFMYNRQYKYIYSNMRTLSTRLMKSYLRQPYIYFTKKSSAELLRNINQDTTDFFGTIQALVHLATEGLVIIILVVYLFIKDKVITMVMAMVLIILLYFFMNIYKKYLYRMGQRNRKYEALVNRWIQQTFGGIKEIKILNKERFFFDKYDESLAGQVKSEYTYHTMVSLPKPVIESGVISALLIAIVIKLYMGVDATYFIPTVSIFAVAAVRLLPSFNRMAEYLGTIIYQKPAVNAIYNELKEAEGISGLYHDNFKCTKSSKLQFTNEIVLDSVCFSYETSKTSILENINLEIKKNTSVAFIGLSGAGKTTLADIIMGVLEPTAGHISVDGVDIKDNNGSWHKTISYIPQNIYLLDDSVKHNVAFGIDDTDINDAKVEEACMKAQLYDYIQSLPEKFETEIGEGGIRLSGGQRQRIGIARALYNNPEVLILDEATSALDNDTEKAVMDAIDVLHGEITLIIIAHRLSTIKNCDYIYRVEDKNIVSVNRGELEN